MKTNRTIQVPVTFGIPKRKADGSVKLEATTSYEVSTDDYMLMDTYRQKAGWLLFKENEFNTEEIPNEQAPTDTKSPSERLRSVLYVYHMQHSGDPSKFRAFYEATIEKYILQIKDKIE